MYKVIKYFTDLQDGKHAYNEGDTYPRAGVTVSVKRIAELAGANNARKMPLIVEVKDEEPIDETPKDEEPKKVKKGRKK